MSLRPGFVRQNTEPLESNADLELQESPAASSSSQNPNDSYEHRNPDIKEGAIVQIAAHDDGLPDYGEAGDGFAKVGGPVATASDLVTQVIHVEDDPSLSPYTFRVFFLGTSLLR